MREDGAVCFQRAHWFLSLPPSSLSPFSASPVPPRQLKVSSSTRPPLSLVDALMTSYARHHASVNLVASGSQQHPHPHSHLQQQQQQQQRQQQHYSPEGAHQHPHTRAHRHKFVAELSQCLFDFVIHLLPTVEELAVKEDVRKLLERLIRTIEPQSRLLSFGSTANGFSLRNSDMDLVCLIDSEEKLKASDLVTMVGDLLERETKFHVKPLPHARIPIVKLSLDPSPGLPLGIACDIGFENRLALENTRLLLCYSLVDPMRVRTLVLFLKVWSKRRKINSPYEGTLSSYGYVLLVIYFLVHVKNPPVLPNLQQIPPLHPIPPEEHHMGNNNIWFFDDIDLLRQRWKSQNTESVGELLIDFFRYYAKDFSYSSAVASIRAGLLRKEAKGWQNDTDPRFRSGERNKLCIEDPFETDYNVARCVTRDGLYIIRGEFMRASRILQLKQDRGYNVLAQLCEERDDTHTKPNGPYNTTFVPPRLSFPPQTPYSVGSHAFRPNGTPARDRLSPPRKILEQKEPPVLASFVGQQDPPEHMAPKRIKFTSPPPPEAPDQDVASFETRLIQGLSLATSSTAAREQENAYMSSSSNSEVPSDDARSDIAQEDDAKSVQSFAGEPSSSRSRSRPGEMQQPFSPSSVPHRLSAEQLAMVYQQANFRNEEDITPTPFAQGQYPRGRRPARPIHDMGQGASPMPFRAHPNEFRRFTFPGKADGLRRSNSGPARAHHAPRLNFGTASAAQQIPFNVPLPPSPVHPTLSSSPTIYYETNAHVGGGSIYSPSPAALPINLTLYQQQFYLAHAHAQARAQAMAQSSQMSEAESQGDAGEAQGQLASRPIHSHTHSTSTIVGPPTPAASSFGNSQTQSSSNNNNNSQHSSPSQSPGPTHTAFGRLPPIQPLQSVNVNNVLPSPTQSSLSSSFGSPSASSRSPQHASAPRQSQPRFSPHLNPHLPQFPRQQPHTPTHIQSFMQAQMHTQSPRFGTFVSNNDPSSLDLASPTDSPVSSGSSQGGSVSGSAGSPGSLSPVSSASPRTADINSPRAHSPERRSHKYENNISDQHQHQHHDHNDQNLSQRTHDRRQQPFSHKHGHITYRQQPFAQTRAHRVTVQVREERAGQNRETEAAESLPRSNGPSDARLPSPSPRSSHPQSLRTLDLSSLDQTRSSISPISPYPSTGSPFGTSHPTQQVDANAGSDLPTLRRIEEETRDECEEAEKSAQEWERVSVAMSRLQVS